MNVGNKEREWADRARRFVKAELKRAEVSYAELARRLKEHGVEETEASITSKLKSGYFRGYVLLGDNEGDRARQRQSSRCVDVSHLFGFLVPLVGIIVLIFLLDLLQYGIRGSVSDHVGGSTDEYDAANKDSTDVGDSNHSAVADAIHTYRRRRQLRCARPRPARAGSVLISK